MNLIHGTVIRTGSDLRTAAVKDSRTGKVYSWTEMSGRISGALGSTVACTFVADPPLGPGVSSGSTEGGPRG